MSDAPQSREIHGVRYTFGERRIEDNIPLLTGRVLMDYLR